MGKDLRLARMVDSSGALNITQGLKIDGVLVTASADDLNGGTPFALVAFYGSNGRGPCVVSPIAWAGIPGDSADIQPGSVVKSIVRLPAKVAVTGIGVGNATPGGCAMTNLAVGDKVRRIIGNLTAGGPLQVFQPGTDFEAVISVANQIQQLSSTDLSLTTIVVEADLSNISAVSYGDFESSLSVSNEIQQLTSGDLSDQIYIAVLSPVVLTAD